jgi:SSS family solute:Na+ symporter
MAGLVIAAICAAGTDSTFNSTSTLILRDIYVRYLRPNASEGESMVVLRTATVVFGILATVIAFGFERATNATAALDVWWKWSGILGGGTLGLFLLGRVSRRADGIGAATGVVLATLLSLWMTFSKDWMLLPDRLRSPFHPLLVIVFCTIVILGVGLLVAAVRKPRAVSAERILVDTSSSVS